MANKSSRSIGYSRISTDKQDAERQVTEILTYCETHKLGAPIIVREIAHGNKDRPELEKILKSLQPNDILVVWELSRLTRGGVGSLFAIVEQIRDKGATLIETKSNVVIDSSVSSEAYLFALGLAARIERDLISERTKSALLARKNAGVKLGRPAGKSKLDERRSEIDKFQKLGLNKSSIAKLLGCSRATYLHWLSKEEAIAV